MWTHQLGSQRSASFLLLKDELFNFYFLFIKSLIENYQTFLPFFKLRTRDLGP